MTTKLFIFAMIAIFIVYALSGCADSSDRIEEPQIPAGLVCMVSGKEVIVTDNQYTGMVFVHYTGEHKSTGLKAKPLRMWVNKSILEC